MGKFGFLAILSGMMILIGYSLYMMLIKVTMPFFIRFAIILIVLGVVVILTKQVFDRQKEKKENEDYKDL